MELMVRTLLGWAFVLTVGAVTNVSSCIVGLRMQRRVKKALGVRAMEVELTSIGTWMRVSREEQG